jgi:hypothetical protein
METWKQLRTFHFANIYSGIDVKITSRLRNCTGMFSTGNFRSDKSIPVPTYLSTNLKRFDKYACNCMIHAFPYVPSTCDWCWCLTVKMIHHVFFCGKSRLFDAFRFTNNMINYTYVYYDVGTYSISGTWVRVIE